MRAGRSSSSWRSRRGGNSLTDLLAAIVAGTRRSVQAREARVPMAALAAQTGEAGEAGRFRAALARTGRINVIAECKRRSPSKGVLRPCYDPSAIARGYADAGAAAISVLTEPTFFDGSLDHLASVRTATGLPILRKDFIVSRYQILEAKAAGADAVLLIVSALDQAGLAALVADAAGAGLDALVEVHDRTELQRAIDAGASIVGVNNRNLRTLDVDVRTSEDLIARMPKEVVAVSESGLKTAGDVVALRDQGYRAFLIGERFMRAAEPGSALRALLAMAAAPDSTGARGGSACS
ncbi:MAG: indole-3-glycerol phosphate synthase TrpC [Acidobacteria bacterium]|nr:indole-3-glycerol phosphate synthase TrpC [Acidobacteriota bacterium]